MRASETDLVVKKGKQKSSTGIDASLIPGYKDKEERNNNHFIQATKIFTITAHSCKTA